MNNPEDIRHRARELGVVAVIPVYNNAGTVDDVVRRMRHHVADVIVVNDGSTDGTAEVLAELKGATGVDGTMGAACGDVTVGKMNANSVDRVDVITHTKNRGKGQALRTGLARADERGFRYALTIDADGQHFPEDAARFMEQAECTPDALVIGARNLAQENMPPRNSFANRFSNFWFRLETGLKMDDTQSGYRLYPLAQLRGMRFVTGRYEFELESAVRLAWRGVRVMNIPVRVHYAPDGERVSHFRPARDFTRISLLNSVLVIVALLWYYPIKFIKWLSWRNIQTFFRDNITHSKESNGRLAAAIGLGVFWGIAPVWGYQMILAGVTAHLLRLNKVVAVASSNISIPPMIPIILLGSFAAGSLVTGTPIDLTIKQFTFENVAGSLVLYIIGSVSSAVVAGAAAWGVSYLILKTLRKERARG